MRYLVAGGAGFIGSALVRALVARGDEVTVVDNLSTGSRENIADVMGDIEFAESDIEDYNTDSVYDTVFHLACMANTSDYMRNRLDVLSSASEGTRNLLDIARRGGSRFVYFSSSEVYGDQPVTAGGTSEDDVLRLRNLNGRSAYAVGKLFSEELVMCFCQEEGLQYAVVRPFNVYGPGMDVKSPYGRVITNFIRSAEQGKPFCINGDGEQTRSFCYIDDFLEAVLKLDSLEELPCFPLNIGNPERITINGLARTVSEVYSSDPGTVHTEPVEYEPRNRMPSIRRAESLLGWKPVTDIRSGIQKIRDGE